MTIIKGETEAERIIRLAKEDAAKKKAEQDAGGSEVSVTSNGTSSSSSSSSRGRKVNWSVNQGATQWTGGKPIASQSTSTKTVTDAKNYMNPSAAEYPWLVENFKQARQLGLTTARSPITYWKTLVDQASANGITPFKMGEAYASGDIEGLVPSTGGGLTKAERAAAAELKLMQSALAQDIEADLTGTAGKLQDTLARFSDSMGLMKSRKEVNSYVKGIMEGAVPEATATDEMRKQATILYSNFADRLNSDPSLTVRDLANPYLQVMADTLEIDPQLVKMTDPTIQNAISGSKLRSLTDFRNDMRADSRFATTRTAKKEAVDFAQSLLKGFGFNI
jgi:hypothetical protein